MKEKLTPYSELDIVLENHGQRIQEVLGDNFVGMYLQSIEFVRYIIGKANK